MKALGAIYKLGYGISFLLIFLGGWLYCVTEYAFFLGVTLGWIPSAIAAAVASIFWPLIVVGLIALFNH